MQIAFTENERKLLNYVLGRVVDNLYPYNDDEDYTTDEDLILSMNAEQYAELANLKDKLL